MEGEDEQGGDHWVALGDAAAEAIRTAAAVYECGSDPVPDELWDEL